MIVIVEGMDNTGKSTLVEQLIKSDKLRGFRVDRSPGPSSSKDIINRVENCLLSEFDNIIYDRFPLISEEIYGPVLRGYSLWEHSHWERYFTQLLQLRPLFIYCQPGRDVILETITQRDQMEGVVEKACVLIDAYDRLFSYLKNFYSLDLIIHNYREDPLAKGIFHKIDTKGSEIQRECQ